MWILVNGEYWKNVEGDAPIKKTTRRRVVGRKETHPSGGALDGDTVQSGA